MAEKYLAMNTLDCQRALRMKHVDMLAECIADKTFLVGDIGFAKLSFNGTAEVMVNGQHQCNAVLQAGQSITATVTHFDCKEPRDLSLLYRQFDNHAARSIGDIARPEAKALKISWPRKVIGTVLTAATIIEGKQYANKKEKVDVLQLHMRDGEFVCLIYEGNPAGARHLMRGPVAACMMRTWGKNRADAQQFWEAVRDGENLTTKSPAKRLRDYLMQTATCHGRGAVRQADKSIASSHEIHAKCITAWNAYRRGSTTDLKYYADKPIPAAV
jgi:hypothetical protein